MPSTITGLIIFVAFLAPGFVYIRRTETRLPGRSRSSLQEAGSLVTVSLLVDTVVLGLFGLARTFSVPSLPDVGALVREPGQYFENHYVRVVGWALLLLLLTMLLAWIAAVPPRWSVTLGERLPDRISGPLTDYVSTRRRRPIEQTSGWGSAFLGNQEESVHVGLRLVDGTYLFGKLYSFNEQLAESPDRSLQLEPPVEIRTSSSQDSVALDCDLIEIAVRNIKTLTVHYLPEPIAASFETKWCDELGRSSS
jgi:hypothetical protein